MLSRYMELKTCLVDNRFIYVKGGLNKELKGD